MTNIALRLLSPGVCIGISTVVLVLALAIRRSRIVTFMVSFAALVSALTALFFVAAPCAPMQAYSLITIDGFSLFFSALILLSSIAITLIAFGFFKRTQKPSEEFMLMLLTATLGAITVCSASHFASFFIGLEVMSISLYVMISYQRERFQGIEAGIKYLIQASIAAAFLLFGMALLYADTGSMELSKIASALSTGGVKTPTLSLIGTAMMLVGIGYKLALVPFHFWAPDTYQGAPTPATAFIATISKIALFGFLVRLCVEFGMHSTPAFKIVLTVMAIASMFIGNVLALFQQNIKRLIAYSSIAHMGYFVSALAVNSDSSLSSALFYVLVYAVSTLCALSVVALLPGENDNPVISDVKGLIFTHPVLGVCLALSFVSFAGLPMGGGFFGKIWIVFADVQSHAWPLAISLMVGSLIGLFYYLRVIRAIFQRPTNPAVVASVKPLTVIAALMSQPGYLVVTTTAFLIILFGFLPGILLNTIHMILAK